MTFELCVPAYNEATVIGPTIGALIEALERTADIDWRIVVADNASTDGTADVVERLGDPRIRVLRIVEKGKGIALRRAAAASAADVFGFIDADLSADPSNITGLLDPVVRSRCDVAVGSRLVDPGCVERGWLRTASSRFFNTILAWMLPLPVRDVQCGLKVMNAKAREVLAGCTENGWFLDAEFLARAARRDLLIQEVPIAWTEFRYAGRRSKLRMVRDGFAALVALRRIARALD